jgi:glycosyltransferase involved in cell wall biosynthesis
MKPGITVILCTHNPDPGRLRRTLEGLRAQTMPVSDWDFVLVDNASTSEESIKACEASWHPTGIRLVEPRLGLAWARVAGIRTAERETLVFVDDDNILDPHYLEIATDILEKTPQQVACGGRVIPEFEVAPDAWIEESQWLLAVRNFGSEALICHSLAEGYPFFAPLGAGMVVRRSALNDWLAKEKQFVGRTGTQLLGCEDCDIVVCAMANGGSVGYFPQLSLTHLIPRHRTEPAYLARLSYQCSKEWVRFLSMHKIGTHKRIPRWTVPLRKLRAFISHRAWKSNPAWIRWRGYCGTFDGQASLTAEVDNAR